MTLPYFLSPCDHIQHQTLWVEAHKVIATLEAQLAEVTAERDEAIISRDANAQTIDRITKEHSREMEIVCSCGDEVQRERDTLRAALRQVAEALHKAQSVFITVDMHGNECPGRFSPFDAGGITCHDVRVWRDLLRLPVVQDVLAQKGGDADGKEEVR